MDDNSQYQSPQTRMPTQSEQSGVSISKYKSKVAKSNYQSETLFQVKLKDTNMDTNYHN